MKSPLISITFLYVFVLLSVCQQPRSSKLDAFPSVVTCPGTFPRHQQGLAYDGRNAIFWSNTRHLTKTDLEGNLLYQVNVAEHHGDLDYYQGKIYVAVNFGKFNQEPGKADNWIYVYDAEDLSYITKKPAPEVVHGAGGVAVHDDRVIIVGGLPVGYEENYVYEYDMDLKYVQRHSIASGYTHLGIQCATWSDGGWWFACYGLRNPDGPGKILQTDDSFNLVASYDQDEYPNPGFAYGFAGIGDDKFLVTIDGYGSRKAELITSGDF